MNVFHIELSFSFEIARYCDKYYFIPNNELIFQVQMI